MGAREKLLPVDCDSIDDLLPDVETVKALNQTVTDPVGLLEENLDRDLEGENVEEILVDFEGIPPGALPELEISRDEDYFEVREEGQLEILLTEIMPRECREDNDGVWLTAVLVSRLAKNQVFGEGNKRTSYLAGVLFLRNLQASKNMDEALIPDLNRELTRLLSDVAVQGENVEKSNLPDYRDLDRDVDELYNYLRRGLRQHVKKNS